MSIIEQQKQEIEQRKNKLVEKRKQLELTKLRVAQKEISVSEDDLKIEQNRRALEARKRNLKAKKEHLQKIQSQDLLELERAEAEEKARFDTITGELIVPSLPPLPPLPTLYIPPIEPLPPVINNFSVTKSQSQPNSYEALPSLPSAPPALLVPPTLTRHESLSSLEKRSAIVGQAKFDDLLPFSSSSPSITPVPSTAVPRPVSPVSMMKPPTIPSPPVPVSSVSAKPPSSSDSSAFDLRKAPAPLVVPTFVPIVDQTAELNKKKAELEERRKELNRKKQTISGKEISMNFLAVDNFHVSDESKR